MHVLDSSVDVEKLTLSPVFKLVVFKSLCDLLSASLPLVLWKSASPKNKKVVPKQGKSEYA
jgi:hypothetical protein